MLLLLSRKQLVGYILNKFVKLNDYDKSFHDLRLLEKYGLLRKKRNISSHLRTSWLI